MCNMYCNRIGCHTEYDMAYAAARCFAMDTNHILVLMAEKAEYLKVIMEQQDALSYFYPLCLGALCFVSSLCLL